MSENPKKNPPEGEDLFAEFRGMGKTAFNNVRANAADAIDTTMRGVHDVEVAVTKGYKAFESFVGRDRIGGAIAGAKMGALLMARPTPFIAHTITIGAIAGGGLGFVFGPAVLERYRKANGNDNNTDQPPASPQPPSLKPDDPAP